eukprot:scaffold56791_cov56-Phaeocystis_antarctica.AAC.4
MGLFAHLGAHRPSAKYLIVGHRNVFFVGLVVVHVFFVAGLVVVDFFFCRVARPRHLGRWQAVALDQWRRQRPRPADPGARRAPLNIDVAVSWV